MTQTEGYVLPLACFESLQACAERIAASELPHPHPAGEVIDYNSVHLTLAGATAERALQEPIFETIRRNVLVRAGGMPSARFEQHSNANPFRESSRSLRVISPSGGRVTKVHLTRGGGAQTPGSWRPTPPRTPPA